MNERLFDGKGAVYAQFRPGYPPALFAHLRAEGLLTPETAAVDVGAGTGIFTRQLAPYVGTVLAVEPNADMRREGRRVRLPNVRFTSGSAERTGLPDASADLISAAQAFHWFDREAFRQECRRLLRPGGTVLLVWNRRVHDSPLTQALAEVNRQFCPGFRGFSGGRDLPADGEAFFRGRFRQAAFPNDVVCGEEAFVGRCLSSSYAPAADGTPYRRALSALFHQYSQDGVIRCPYVTQCCYGGVEEPGAPAGV